VSGHEIALAASLGVMVAGAAVVALASDVIRMVIGLGAFLVGVALAFLSLGGPLLAAAEVFAYVGGVLVLVLFALMLTHRSADERPRVTSRRDVGAVITAVLVFGVMAWVIGPISNTAPVAPVDPALVAEELLGAGLPAFELAGLLLLLALLAVIAIVKGGEDR
jgi:NADH-quinone oxidoreductase subunit J